MAAITEWVAPAAGLRLLPRRGRGLGSDTLYTKVVARRMLQMTQHINADWKPVTWPTTGVTCYTCHRGQPVPATIWFNEPRAAAGPGLRRQPGRPEPAGGAGRPASLPYDPFTPFLQGDSDIRVISTDGAAGRQPQLDQADGVDLRADDAHVAGAGRQLHLLPQQPVVLRLGPEHAAARTKAWYGIRMARDLNNTYLEPLQPVYPPHRLGPTGDVPKVNCATCHQGAYKPLFGQSILKDYQGLGPYTPGPTAALATQ